MNFLDKVKSLLKGRSGQISQGIDKAAQGADKLTKGKYADKIDKASGAAKSAADKLASDNPAAGRADTVDLTGTDQPRTSPTTTNQP